MRTLLSSWFWRFNALARVWRFPAVSPKSRTSLFAQLRGGRNRIVVGPGTLVESSAVLDARGGEIVIGRNCEVHSDARLLSYGGLISIGDDSSVNPFTILYGHHGLRIGAGVRIAAHCVLIPADHVFERTDVAIATQGTVGHGIVIEDDVWLGAGVRVLDGVTIGRGAVIGAGAVVVHDVPAFEVHAGVPARFIRRRSHP
jgi:acetyltransferase-like isoleucine patch superfamily enzyme